MPLALVALSLAACGASGAPARPSAPVTAPAPTGAPPTSTLTPTGGPSTAPAPPASAPLTPTTRAVPVPGPPPTTAPSGGASGAATSGSLTVTLTASPSHVAPDQEVEFVVSARDSRAHGVLAYQLTFGDGAGTHNVTPLLCTATAAPQEETWGLSHAYGANGTYTVSATVSANCTPDRATASVALTVS